MKKLIIISVILLLITIDSKSQLNYNKVWVTGSGVSYKIAFEAIGIQNTILDTFFSPYFSKGNSNICDTNGNLILCSDGFNIYDSSANFLDGGDTLVNVDYYNHYTGWSPYPQTSIFLPMDSDIYYFVTPTYSQGYLCYSCHFDLLQYSIIDMKENGGTGKVVKRMQALKQNTKLSRSQMMACRHSNGRDWWLLKQGGDSNTVYKFLFTQDSVYDYGSQSFINPIWGAWDLRGQSAISADGSKYATCVEGNINGEFFMADFDRCYGILSNPKIVFAPMVSWHNPTDTTLLDGSLTGLAYSPNGKFLYVIFAYNIFQYDLEDETFYHVAGLDTSWLKFQMYSSSYLGPDNKLYIGNWGGGSKQMSVINNPDIKGIGCNFCPRCLRLDSVFHYGGVATPPCMPNYALGAQVCWPLQSESMRVESEELTLYPNPAFDKVEIKYISVSNDNAKLEIYNSLGQVLYSASFEAKSFTVDVCKLSKGIYFVKVGSMVKKLSIN